MSLVSIPEAVLEDLGRLRAPEGYLRAGWPRFHTLFGRDSLIAAWQLIEPEPSIAVATLRILAKFQGRRDDPAAEEEPGKILHEYRFDPAMQAELPGWVFPYYGSVDSTPLFLVLAGAYLRQTGDRALLAEMWPALVAAHDWLARSERADRDGFIRYLQRNPAALFHQGWKDGSADHLRIHPPVALVEVQGYAYAAHRAFAAIGESLGHLDVTGEALRAAERLRRSVNGSFWWSKEGTFYLALDGEGRPRAAITSNPGHLLLSDVVDPDKRASLVRRLFGDDLWTPYGIRTHGTSEPDFDPYGYHLGTIWPHDNWMIYTGLRLSGFHREAMRVRRALLTAYGEMGRLPELYGVVNDRIVDLSADDSREIRVNPIQAWAIGALVDCLLREDPTTP